MAQRQTRLTATGRTKTGKAVKKRPAHSAAPTPRAGEVVTSLRVYRNTKTGKLRTG